MKRVTIAGLLYVLTVGSVPVAHADLATYGEKTSAHTTSPGSNGEIAYVRHWSLLAPDSLRTVHPDGSHGRVLLSQNEHAIDAAWSPDGSSLALFKLGASNRILFMDADTRDQSLVIRVRDFPEEVIFVRSIAFAPTGDALVVCTDYLSGFVTTRLFTLDIDGSNVTMVSDRPDCYADWSSTGRIVAVRGDRAQRIVTMDPDGSNTDVAVVESRKGLGDGIAISPSWSPDGSRFAYAARDIEERRYDLFLLNGDGSGLQQLTDTPRRSEYAPLFSPDASTIAFAKSRWPLFGRQFSRSPDADILSIAVDGSNRQRLTDTPSRGELPLSWQTLSG